jgi:putative heme iron utilization protein
MKSSWFFSVILFFLLGACVNGEQTFRADHTHLISGGNSKVWQLMGTQQTKDAQLKRNDWGETMFVFYVSGEVLVGSFGDFDKGTFDKGHFKFHSKQDELSVHIASEKWRFKLDVLSEDHLVLRTIKGQNLATYLHLIPLEVPN